MFLVQLSYCKQVSFSWLFRAMFFYIFVLFWGAISLFRVAPKCSPEMLSGVPTAGKLGCALRRKYVLDELCSSTSFGAVGRESNVNENFQRKENEIQYSGKC